MTPLQALERIIKNVQAYTNIDIEQELDTIAEALHVPSADDICEALSEWLNKEVPDLFNYKVYYDNGGFHYYNTEDFEDYLVEYYEVDETMTLSVFLPPSLVSLIARFYEGQE